MNTTPKNTLNLILALFAAGIAACVGSTMTTGCSTSYPQQVATPARVEAVTALGAYYGGKKLIQDGHRQDVQSSYDALTVMSQTGDFDAVSVAAALDAAGLNRWANEDGALLISGASIVFIDSFAGTTQVVKKKEYVKAVLEGCRRGFGVALAVGSSAKGAPVESPADVVMLKHQAFKSRPVK